MAKNKCPSLASLQRQYKRCVQAIENNNVRSLRNPENLLRKREHYDNLISQEKGRLARVKGNLSRAERKNLPKKIDRRKAKVISGNRISEILYKS